MKFVFLTVVFAAVVTAKVKETIPSLDPLEASELWEVGKQYIYEMSSQTFARFQEGPSSGSLTKALLNIRVKAPGRLQANLENVQHTHFNQELPKNISMLQELEFKRMQKLEEPFHISVDGGRVLSLSFPQSLSLEHENFLKGIVSSLQLDFTPHRKNLKSHDYFDKKTRQGQYRKMETDVTGDCETLYDVAPYRNDPWSEFEENNGEIVLEVTKSKNYGKCNHRVAYHFGVPEGAEWTGTAHKQNENQLMKRALISRVAVDNQGSIFKADVESTVFVSPFLYGKQKIEVNSRVSLKIQSIQSDDQPQWVMPEHMRFSKSLLYSMSESSAKIDYSSESSSSSESAETADNQQNNREKRSMKKGKAYRTVAINKIVFEDSGERIDAKGKSSTSGSSSSDSSSAFVNDDMPKTNEPAYAALYMNPTPQAENKHNPATATRLVQEVAQQLQNPNIMPKADTLSRFNILVRTIAAMTTEQLRMSSRAIEIAKSSNNVVKVDMWMVYRDAVAQAGTFPAFQQIKTWIQSRKLEGEEAAQVIATLPTSLRYPTRELMYQFFQLAWSEEVIQQRYLNSTALISATRFINMGKVNKYMAHSNYPTHMYGKMSKKNDDFVQKEVLPRLQGELDQAFTENDDHKAMVVIRAAGNLGHRGVLNVFAPYLEGKIPVSNYLRRFMVESMDVLAYEQDPYARAVFYSILKNTAEPYDMRVAAVFNIFMSRPTSAMMESMAHMTHHDPSIQVRAAIKSAIQSAARLQNPQYMKFARTAQASEELLTKEDLSRFYSHKQFMEFYNAEEQLDSFNVLNYMGSDNSIIPKFIQYAQTSNTQGWLRRNSASASFSNARQFIEYFKQQMENANGQSQKQNKTDANHKYSAQKIAELLGIKRDPESPVGTSFNVNLMDQQRFFALTQQDMNMLPEELQKIFENLKKGTDYHYTKLLNQARTSIMFPVASGMPFIFKYKEPTLIHYQGNAKANWDANEETSIEKEIQFTYARNKDGSVGFLDTLSNHYASAGVVSKIQVNIPVKVKLEWKSNKQFEMRINIEPIRPNEDTTIAHYSTWPYTAKQKKDTHTTVGQDPTTKVISGPKKTSAIDAKLGQSNGMQFLLHGYSYSSDFNPASMFREKDLASNAVSAFYRRDVALTHFNLRYQGKQSANQAVTLTASYEKAYGENSEKPLKPSQRADVSPNSRNRRQEMLGQASSGIDSPMSKVIDLSATFEGPMKTEYVMTAAIGYSSTNKKNNYLFFFSRNNDKQGNSQVNFAGTVTEPNFTTMNFNEALKLNIKTSFNGQLKYGKNDDTDIRVDGYMQRSRKSEDLAQNPIAKQCQEEMLESGYRGERKHSFQEACYKALLLAHAPDFFKASVTYKNLSPQAKNMSYLAYRMTRHLGFSYSDENILKSTADGKVEIEAQASYDDNTFSASVNSRVGELQISNVPMPEKAFEYLAMYPPMPASERLANAYSNNQYYPYCVILGSKVKTFSNREYNTPLSKSYSVMMMDEGRYAGKYDWDQEQIAVLVREVNEKKEVYISIQSENGDAEIRIRPSEEPSQAATVDVKSEMETSTQQGETTYWNSANSKPVIRYSFMPDGVLLLNIEEDRLKVIYDSQSLVLLADHNRNNTRGMCGYMSGEPADDYNTPNGIINKGLLLTASYSLVEEDDAFAHIQRKAAKEAYKQEMKYTTILRSDPEFKKYNNDKKSSSSEENSESNVYRVKSYQNHEGPCQVHQQVQYYEDHGDICISTKSIPSCSPQCRGDDHSVRAVQVVCRPKIDQDFKSFRDQILQGQNPEVTGPVQSRQFKVPSACIA